MKRLFSFILVVAISLSFTHINASAETITVLVEDFDASNYSTIDSPARIDGDDLVLISERKKYVDAKYRIDLEPNTEYTIVWDIKHNSYKKGDFVAVRANGFLAGSDIKFPKEQTGTFSRTFTTASTITEPYIWSYAYNTSGGAQMKLVANFKIYKDEEIVVEEPVVEEPVVEEPVVEEPVVEEPVVEEPVVEEPVVEESVVEEPVVEEPVVEEPVVEEPVVEEPVVEEPVVEEPTTGFTYSVDNFSLVEAPSYLDNGEVVLTSNGTSYVDVKYDVELTPATDYVIVFDISENTYTDGNFVAVRANGFTSGSDIKFPKETTGYFEAPFTTESTISNPFVWSFANNKTGGADMTVRYDFHIYEAANYNGPVEQPTEEPVVEEPVIEYVPATPVAQYDASAYTVVESPSVASYEYLTLTSNQTSYVDAKQAVELQPNTEYLLVLDIVENTYTDGNFVAVRANGFTSGSDIKFPQATTGEHRVLFTTASDITNAYVWSFANNKTGGADMSIKYNFKIYDPTPFADPMTDELVVLAGTEEPTPSQEPTTEEPTFTENAPLTENEIAAYNVISWQLSHGGWGKNNDSLYTEEWDGTGDQGAYIVNGIPYGTIDNGATVPEIEYLIQVYNETGNEDMKVAALKGIDFLLNMQYETGALPQVYPRSNEEKYDYIHDATFNDDATISVLRFYQDILSDRVTYNEDVISTELYGQIEAAFYLAIDYILNAQIEVDGQLTAWCAQHDPYTFEATSARAYEHASISGYESINIVKFLISLGTEDQRVVNAVESAVRWYNDAAVQDTKYNRYATNGEYFEYAAGRTMWYRFYEIGTNRGIFSDRDGIIRYDIWEVGEERREGYVWAGNWAETLKDFQY